MELEINFQPPACLVLAKDASNTLLGCIRKGEVVGEKPQRLARLGILESDTTHVLDNSCGW
jgi:hypothetical protein